MAKIIRIERCEECLPYRCINCPRLNFKRVNLKTIDPDCPLEDAPSGEKDLSAVWNKESV